METGGIMQRYHQLAETLLIRKEAMTDEQADL